MTQWEVLELISSGSSYTFSMYNFFFSSRGLAPSVSHPKAKDLRFKPFPLFERLRAIYGKDIAKGKQSQTPGDVQEEVDREMEIEDLTTDDVSGMGFFEESQTIPPLAPTCDFANLLFLISGCQDLILNNLLKTN
ncbi:hypothetical protein ACFE04_015190 [Oxalis oulophora]